MAKTHSQGFQFKQFFIAHNQCAMKVNTDGILLGAIADITHANHILDLGTGTGLIAIMLAQRTACQSSQITAIELETNAFHQARQNVALCRWSERIRLLQSDVMAFTPNQSYDLIVANPPYFSHSPPSRNHARDLARSAIYSHFDWLQQATHFVSSTGKISFILPSECGETLISQSSQLALHCLEIWYIHTKIHQPAKRMIVTFSPQSIATQIHHLDIYDETQQYSANFQSLTRDFYLNMP